MVLVTHDMAVIRDACDRVLVLDHGRVVEHGTVNHVFAAPHTEATLALLRPLRQRWAASADGASVARAPHTHPQDRSERTYAHA